LHLKYKFKHENSHTLTAIDKRLTELQAELLKRASSLADYEKVGDEIYQLREEKQKAQLENLGRDELKKRISDISTFLQELPIALTECDEALVRRLIEKITATRTNSLWNLSPVSALILKNKTGRRYVNI